MAKKSLEAVVLWGDEAMRFWPAVEPILHRAWVRGFNPTSVASIQKKISTGENQLWLMLDYDTKQIAAAFVTRLVDNPGKGKWLEAFYGAGHGMRSWKDLILHAWEHFAKENYCDGVYIIGRRGWQKMCEPNGYEPELVTLVKEF